MSQGRTPVLSPARLRPLVRHYAWGDREFLPELLGAPADGRPWAEAWFGAHPTGSASIGDVSLHAAIARDPERWLGPQVASRYGQLPYLLKVIAPRRPLSIQVHPGRADAEHGFAAENARGLSLDDPTRCYRDPNAKPELLYAITPFRTLCGFRSRAEVALALADLPEWTRALAVTPDAGLPTILDRLASCHDADVTKACDTMIARLQRLAPRDPDDPSTWAVRAYEDFGPDRALLLLFLLAPRRLAPGECLFVHPGTVHAYLDGVAVEVMANSDNVVRAGLTAKHVDLAEFVRTARLAPAPPVGPVCREPGSTEAIVPAPTHAFRLTRLDVHPSGVARTASGPETWLVPPGAGSVRLETSTGSLSLGPGEAVFVPHGLTYRLIAERLGTRVLGASVPPLDDPWASTGRVLHNLATTEALVDHGTPAAVVAFVSGNASSVRTWANRTLAAPRRFGAREGVSLLEDRPVNQAFGVLLAWQRLRHRVKPGDGCLAAFVFGEGTRATPLTEAEGGDKPAIRTFVRDATSPDGFATTAEVALRTFLPVESFLRRSGFDGFVVKWGDEIQIPSIDLSGRDPRLAGADVVRFVSMQPMTEETAAHKDWIGMDDDGVITGFLARRPLESMRARVGRGVLLQGDQLVGGINLGSVAMSRDLLDALCEEFAAEIDDPNADRRTRPDLDPQFFTALTLATEPDPVRRREATQATEAEVPALAALREHWPDLVERLHGVVKQLEQRRGRPLSLRALDLGDPFWGDVGQHRQMYTWLQGLRDPSLHGVVTRALAGLPAEPDADGNWIADDCELGPDVRVRDSVLLGVRIGSGEIERAVLLGTTATTVHACDAFDHGSLAPALELGPRSGGYRVIADTPVVVPPGERLTTVFLPEGPVAMRVHETTKLRDREKCYDVPILGNPLSFRDAHRRAAEVDPASRTELRRKLREKLLQSSRLADGN